MNKTSQERIMDGNEAAAYIAYKTNEVCAIYPITPSSAMGEHCDEWAAAGKTNIFGQVPKIIEMQSEAGAAGAVHGSIQGGALSSTFTCSQGLLLMIPNMYKIAGEHTPAVFHIAARALATHALSIFGDHSDVMAVRQTGWAMLFGKNAQEAMDMALIAQAATLKSKIPFLNIFDGFRTSHELSKVSIIPDEIIQEMLDMEDVLTHRKRAMSPDNPSIRGTAQNPDVFFQSREAGNPYYINLPQIIEKMMDKFAELTGRQYHPVEYYGAEDAEDVLVIMGSGANTVHEMVDYMNEAGAKTGCLYIRMFRPFDAERVLKALPKSAKRIAVLDRCKEPGAQGEPLYMDLREALRNHPQIADLFMVGGRYGLASKEFDAGMVKALFENLNKKTIPHSFSIGIDDDVTKLSIDWDREFSLEDRHLFRGLFYGLGADGTVSANKNSIKIIGESTDNHVQGYFVYDSKKSGSMTVSHLRFDKHPIRSAYLVNKANFIACHQFNFIRKYPILKHAERNSILLLNAPYEASEVWQHIPGKTQQEILDKNIRLYVIDAGKVARENGMAGRVNTILQTCFFAISGVLEKDFAIQKIKDAIKKSYSDKGDAIVAKNYAAVDQALANLHAIDTSGLVAGNLEMDRLVQGDAPDFVQDILSKIMAFEGDELPVSSFPVDGTYPVATTKWEKRNLATEIPVWDAAGCSQCGKCFIICPHAAIRAKVYDKSLLANAPETFKHTDPIGKEFNKETEAYSLQVAVEDCTGCNLCVEFCPVESKLNPGQKVLHMHNQLELKDTEKANWEFFLDIPEMDRSRANVKTVKGSQFLEPLFEFSGACSGCGETPYLKLLTQLYGDRMLVANATGCSSIYGANLPTTPWSCNEDGKGPAWANSLFEDNAEFGLGIKLAYERKTEFAKALLRQLPYTELVEKILNNKQESEAEIAQQRVHVDELKQKIADSKDINHRQLVVLADHFVKKSHWIIGGDGWAYDIGFSGLDHVLSSGENVNILVLDTEVYSNTGGQKSKSTPIGASAKFSVNGKTSGKKDLAMQAIAHGSAYVAQIALGANDMHALKAIQEAEAFDGPSIVIAYSHCIAHGYDMSQGANHQQHAVKSGYWPLFRYNPSKERGERFVIDSKDPVETAKEFMAAETRFSILKKQNPEHAQEFVDAAQEGIDEHWMKLKTLKDL